MKITVSFFLFAALSVLFYGCKSDDTISSNSSSDAVYNWTMMDFTAIDVSNISMADDQSLFFSGRKGYRIIEGISQQLNFNDSIFFSSMVSALNKDYAVFVGANNSGWLIKIYDNGVIRTYELNEFGSDFVKVFVESRDKFYIYSLEWGKYILFENGVMTSFPIPAFNAGSYMIGKINNDIYTITARINGVIGNRIIYKILPSGPSEFFSESPYPTALFYYTGNNFVKISYDELGGNTFYYFKDTAWVNMFGIPAGSLSFNAIGGPESSFVIFSTDEVSSLKPSVWDGNALTQQTNFPQGLVYNPGSTRTLTSEYKSGAFYFYCSTGTGKILKAVLR